MKRVVLVAIMAVSVVYGCSKSSGDTMPAPDPTLSVGVVTQVEGNMGTTNFEFVVTLSSATTKPVTITYSVEEGSAKAVEDFVAIADQNLVIQPGETSKKINVSVVADDIKEPDETFVFTITKAVNAKAPSTGVIGTIINDDTKIAFSNAGYDAPNAYPGYTLAWSDEFNGSGLNMANWSFQNGNGCPNLCGWGNNELETYAENNLFLQDGKMIIEARREGSSYTSAKIISSGKKKFKFGRIDIRAKLPKGKGIWPALWMMPESSVYGGWPRSGEIDIMELLGHEPNKTYGTLHYGPGPGSTQINKSFVLPSGDFSSEFHVFSLDWKQDQIQWLVDGNVFGTASKANFGSTNYPFNEQFYFIINLAVGGQWPGNPDATTTFPQWMIVDYVRVYQ
ncbi:glycosyl hydrolase family protein [Segetibacter sp. 3557_3]|uniref:family 16 glycosylhydrolase n=1 Tax=Segetibacter sp. 3557_3 TaxID=2547429 RepID=UPI00105916D6|nr:family 16 glycosylhydrolase [Segetibacter sp. 3557_3]TDH26959.1 glycosyl hydrolase family protein [Segetibacter sp. 3557_3]